MIVNESIHPHSFILCLKTLLLPAPQWECGEIMACPLGEILSDLKIYILEEQVRGKCSWC